MPTKPISVTVKHHGDVGHPACITVADDAGNRISFFEIGLGSTIESHTARGRAIAEAFARIFSCPTPTVVVDVQITSNYRRERQQRAS